MLFRSREPEDGVGLEALGVIQSRQGKECTIDIGASINEIERLTIGLGGRHGGGLGAGGQGQGWLIELPAHAINDAQQSRLADHFRLQLTLARKIHE